jgi:FKBP-type peptidyl-prolyl cis-trans isomerase 2
MKTGLFSKGLALMCLFLCGCAGQDYPRTGDPVQADFTCRLADGSLVETTLATVAGDDSAAKSPIFDLRDSYRPVKFTVAQRPEALQSRPFDPLEQKIAVAIARRAGELSLEHPTELKLPSQEVENFPPKDRYLNMATHVTIPRTRDMPLEQFMEQYRIKPVKGAVIGQDTDFPGVVRAVNEKMVTLYFSAASEGVKIPLGVGLGSVRTLDEKNFEVKMDIHMGQLTKRVGGLPGRVTAVDAETFTVDFGQSFAGETLQCEVTTRPDTTSGQEAKASPVNWQEDFDKGLALAKQQGKPVVLLLYADWCKYCHQMLESVFPDPSLDPLRDSFVWLKIDSAKFPEYAERFGQKSYPLTLILNPDGTEVEKLSGLQKVATLATRLDGVLGKRNKTEQAQ